MTRQKYKYCSVDQTSYFHGFCKTIAIGNFHTLTKLDKLNKLIAISLGHPPVVDNKKLCYCPQTRVTIHHLHVKRFHMVKILRKSVQYVRRYSTKMPVFWPCRTWRSQMSSIFSGVTRQKFTKFLDDIATSSPLLTRTFKQWYCNSFER